MLVVSYALGRGKTSGWATVPGVILGDFTAMTASLLGGGVILVASATLFTALKLVGTAYLIWLGIKLWCTTPKLDDHEQHDADAAAYHRLGDTDSAQRAKNALFRMKPDFSLAFMEEAVRFSDVGDHPMVFDSYADAGIPKCS